MVQSPVYDKHEKVHLYSSICILRASRNWTVTGEEITLFTDRVWTRFAKLLAIFFISLGAPLGAQNYNPNHLDAVNIMTAIEHPHSDLVVVSSHRGLHALIDGSNGWVPENSRWSMGLTGEAGIEEIELDVKLTSDGVPILSHDLTWGREWCNYGFSNDRFDPFTAQGISESNDSVDFPVNTISFADTRGGTAGTVIRDTVSIIKDHEAGPYYGAGCGSGRQIYGEYPSTLQEALQYISQNKIPIVVALDLRDPATAKAAWSVVASMIDYKGRPLYQSTLFKIPSKGFIPPSGSPAGTTSIDIYKQTFGAYYGEVHFQPVYNTGDIAATVYGSEAGMTSDLKAWETEGAIDVSAVEIQYKKSGGILTSFLNAAKTNFATGQSESITVFSPFQDYVDPNDASKTPQFFTTTGYCCVTLANFYYNVPGSSGYDSTRPSDSTDDRGDINFVVSNGYTGVTRDDSNNFLAQLKSRGLRNISYMQDGTQGSSTTEVFGLMLPPTDLAGPQAGDSLQIDAELNAPSATGTAQLEEGSTTVATAPIIDGSASFVINSLTAGVHTYTAVYPGDGYNPSATSNSVALTVNQSNSGGGGGGGGGNSGGSGSGRSTEGVCDIYAAGGTPCVAAHSTTRALYSNYSGNLYRVLRAADNNFLDVGVSPSTGFIVAAPQDSFCSNTTCTISTVYDQTSFHNDLSVEGPGGNGPQDLPALANAIPMTINGNKAYGMNLGAGVGYRNNYTKGVATGSAPEGMYMVTSGTNVNGACCFDYGNAETSTKDTGNGHMDALNFGTYCEFGPCSGPGPWVEADLENGQYMGNGQNSSDTTLNSNFVTATLKNDGKTIFSLRGGNAQSGGLITMYAGSLPTVHSGYTPMSKEGAIVLGTGGDNSNSGVGSFFEGVITAGYPSDATEDSVQANIVAAGYGGSSNPTASAVTTYNGPNDPNGPGPQDGFEQPADLQANDFMGSKPSMAYFNNALFVGFRSDDSRNQLFVTSTAFGQPYSAATGYANIHMGSAPALAVFNHQLFVGFKANDSSNEFFITSSTTGGNFPTATGYSNLLMGSAPSLIAFNHQLILAFQANDSSHSLQIAASNDGVTWPRATGISNVNIGGTPALAVFNHKLYVAFRANDASNDLWFASSADGITFTSQLLSSQSMGANSSPALVVSNGVLYCIYSANDGANEMLVTASNDGSTWQGPAAYLNARMGASGPAATAYPGGITVSFQSDDARNALFTSFKNTEAASYTGPNDPNGPGPQDMFPSAATMQANILMGSKPAMASIGNTAYTAFLSDDPRNLLFVSSTPLGQTFPAATLSSSVIMGSAPAMAVFNSQLYVAFQSNDTRNLLFTTASSTTTFPAATGSGSVQIGGVPALAVFNGKLWAAFQSNDARNLLYTTSLSSGTTFPAASASNGVQMGSAPAMSAFHNKLFVAFKALNPGNAVIVASSTDGVNFTSQALPNQYMGGDSSPAVVADICSIYVIYRANDAGNEMLVTSSTDGSTWLGPKLYSGVQMGPAGPAASGLGAGGYTVGFQSNDARSMLFTEYGKPNYGTCP